jgi:hypothetical protein
MHYTKGDKKTKYQKQKKKRFLFNPIEKEVNGVA